jgi:ribosome recycling factor
LKNNFKDELQKKVDASNKKLEEIFDKKQVDIMSV